MPVKSEDNTQSLSRGTTPDSDPANENVASGGIIGFGSSVLIAPLNLLNSVAVNGIAVLRPYAPQFVPVIVCLFLIPLAVCLSLFAGWMVWKNVAVGWETPLYLQYGESTIPYARVPLPPLKPSQPYDISVHLTLPTSDSNLSLGNFMTRLTISTFPNRTLALVSRPAIAIPPKASLFFAKPNIINLSIPLLDSFISGATKVLAHVEIGRADGWRNVGNGQVREVNVLSASLRGTAIPRGIRGLAMRFPLLAAFLSSCTFLVILSLIIGSCVLPTVFPVPIDQSTNEIESDPFHKFKHKAESEPPSISRVQSSSSTLRRRRSKLSKHTSSSSRIQQQSVKPEGGEGSVMDIPPATGATEEVPDISAHSAGSTGTARGERLRRRASQRFERSGGEETE